MEGGSEALAAAFPPETKAKMCEHSRVRIAAAAALSEPVAIDLGHQL
jgi:hypothetical protein